MRFRVCYFQRLRGRLIMSAITDSSYANITETYLKDACTIKKRTQSSYGTGDTYTTVGTADNPCKVLGKVSISVDGGGTISTLQSKIIVKQEVTLSGDRSLYRVEVKKNVINQDDTTAQETITFKTLIDVSDINDPKDGKRLFTILTVQ